MDNVEVDIVAGAAAGPTPTGVTGEELQDGLDALAGAGYGPTPVPEAGRPTAFFDIDNTLVRGSSIVGFGAEMVRQRFVPLHSVLPALWQEVKFRLSGTENPADLQSGADLALSLIQGRSVADLEERCTRYVEQRMKRHTIPGARVLAERHLAAGEEVWLISATPLQLSQALARGLGFTGGLGTVAEIRDGRFTGRLCGGLLHGRRKRNVLAALAARDDLDLAGCTAYSDSANDIPMLEIVGRAVAVNPDPVLRRHAEQMGWEVHDFDGRRMPRWALPVVAVLTAALLLWLWRQKTAGPSAPPR